MDDACPECGNEVRGQGGYLSCECPAPSKPEPRPWKIDGYPVSAREVLDAATLIHGKTVQFFNQARRILREEGRDITKNEDA